MIGPKVGRNFPDRNLCVMNCCDGEFQVNDNISLSEDYLIPRGNI